MKMFQLLRITRLQLLVMTAMAGLFLASVPAGAHGRTFVSFGVNVGGPYCYRPYCGPWGYYRPYPYVYYNYYVPPPAVVVEPAPVVLQPAPVVTQSPPVVDQPATSPVQPIYRATSAAPSDQTLQLLSHPDESVRQKAVMDLGRAKDQGAVDSLAATLAGDSSPAVRDAAARALGLIADPRSLPALTRAAQADNDRDVRHSAQFAVEIIRSNLRQR